MAPQFLKRVALFVSTKLLILLIRMLFLKNEEHYKLKLVNLLNTYKFLNAGLVACNDTWRLKRQLGCKNNFADTKLIGIFWRHLPYRNENDNKIIQETIGGNK